MTPPRDLIVIGSSAGGVPVLLELAARLPADFPAAILLVQHIGAHPSELPNLLQSRGPLQARFPYAGEALAPSTIYVAPPDQHMMVEEDAIVLTREPKENYARPAIDPLFRSVAIAKGSSAIGVILSGLLDDGTAGLQAIKACGGIAIVQNPEDAQESEMPRSAADNVTVDFVISGNELAGTLQRLVAEPRSGVSSVPPELLQEYRLSRGQMEDPVQALDQIGSSSKIVCPECGGVLWELIDTQPKRYRCHTGHAYTLRTLDHAQSTRLDQAVWTTLRVLQERELLLRNLAEGHQHRGEIDEAARAEAEASHLSTHSIHLQRLLAS